VITSPSPRQRRTNPREGIETNAAFDVDKMPEGNRELINNMRK
jgi:hypothetical protein